ncbi:hypothetical protein AUP68_03874 [Ilyonectria robusta]
MPELENREDVVTEQWHQIADAIKTTTWKAFQKGSSSFPSNAAFRSHWYSIFTQLEESILSDQNIPEFLTSPPIKNLTITVIEMQDWLGNCPCCWLQDQETEIALQNDSGVTKGDFIRALKEHLYGEIPETNGEDLESSSFWSFMYSSSSRTHEEVPHIFIKCCEQGELRKIKEREKRQ